MKKIILLSTAAALLTPLAAKANQKSSIFVGAFGTLERLATQHGTDAASDYLKDENFWALGIEGGFGYKVWKDMQISGWLRAGYSFEHEFKEGKVGADGNRRKDPYALIVEPRVTFGWEFAVANNMTITPFIGFGVEMNFSKKEDDKWGTDVKVPAVLGARFAYNPVYVSINGRFDVNSQDINKADAALGRDTADSVRYWGVEASIGAEF